MLGAIIGDIVGSRFEWKNHKSKDFELFHEKCSYTDDSVMTLAIAKAILTSNHSFSNLSDNAIITMREFGQRYPSAGYGGRFVGWVFGPHPRPYGSYGNGAAMRVSACGFVASSLEEAKLLSKKVTCVTHNHPEGLKGAEATAVGIYLAKNGKSKEEIGTFINQNYYKLDFKIDDIRSTYRFNETCQGTVPEAIEAFLESDSYEDAIRTAISVGGDSDTLAAITGGIAEAYYGIPKEIRENALTFLDDFQKSVLFEFERKYPFEKK